MRGGAGVARFARSSWIWAGIIPQEKRETAGSPVIVGFARFSDRSAIEGRWKMDAITLALTTRFYDVVRFCYLCFVASILSIILLYNPHINFCITSVIININLIKLAQYSFSKIFHIELDQFNINCY